MKIKSGPPSPMRATDASQAPAARPRSAPAQHSHGAACGPPPLPQALRTAEASTSARPRVALPTSTLRVQQAPHHPLGAGAPPGGEEDASAPKERFLSEYLAALWKGASRRNGFAPFQQAYARFTGTDITGVNFLRRVFLLTESAEARPLPTDNPEIKRYALHIEGTDKAVHVLRRDRDDGSIGDLRVAKSDSDSDVRQVTKQIEAAARFGIAMRAVRRPPAAAKSPESVKAARAGYLVWRKRKDEFSDLYEACRGQPGHSKLTGPQFLLLVHTLTDNPSVVPVQTRVEGIRRFVIKVPGVDANVVVLRQLHEDGTLVDLHLVQSAAQQEDLLDSMNTAAKRRHSTRNPEARTSRKPPPDVVHLKSLWRTLRQSLNEQYKAYLDHQRARDPNYLNSAQLFVRHLNELCDGVDGVVVDQEHRITRHEVKPYGSDETLILLRRTDERGLANLHHVSQDRTALAEGVRAIIKQARRFERMNERAAAAASEARPAKRARTTKSPSESSSQLTHVNQLKQALAVMVENEKNNTLPLLTGVADKTGVAEGVFRSWLKHDGGLKRSVNSLVRLAGYYEARDELHELFTALGQHETADLLPQAVTAGLLARVLAARAENPLAVTAERLAKLVPRSTSGVIHRHVDARAGTLRQSDAWLRHLPGYDEHREILRVALHDLGHVERAAGLPRPESEGEKFLRAIQEEIYPLAAAAQAMRADPTLTAQAAAQLTSASPETADMLNLLVGPGGAVRNQAAIHVRRPGLGLDRLPGLDSLLRQLGTSSSGSGMTHVLMPKQGQQVAKLFVVDAAGTRPLAGKTAQLSDVYANSPGLAVGRRSYAADCPRQTLRWLSTVLKNEFKNATEIQCYYDPKKHMVWVSSNHERVNEQIHDFLKHGGLMQLVGKSTDGQHRSRLGRHTAKLRMMLADSSQHLSAVAGDALRAMSEGRFKVPVETFHLNGQQIDLHAERRIKDAFRGETGKALNHQLLGGTMRPCGICAKDLDLPSTVHRGPFWLSRAGQAFYNVNEVVDENVQKSIGSYASRSIDGRLSVNHDTDSDSDVGNDAGPSTPYSVTPKSDDESG